MEDQSNYPRTLTYIPEPGDPSPTNKVVVLIRSSSIAYIHIYIYIYILLLLYVQIHANTSMGFKVTSTAKVRKGNLKKFLQLMSVALHRLRSICIQVQAVSTEMGQGK